MRPAYEVAVPVEPDPPLLAVDTAVVETAVPPVLELLPVELEEVELATVAGTVPVEPEVTPMVARPMLELAGATVALGEVVAVPDEVLVEAEASRLEEDPSSGGGSDGAPKHPESRKQRRTALDRHRMGFPFSDVPLERTGGGIWTNGPASF